MSFLSTTLKIEILKNMSSKGSKNLRALKDLSKNSRGSLSLIFFSPKMSPKKFLGLKRTHCPKWLSGTP